MVITWLTFATESFERPEALAGIKTFPGASTGFRLAVKTTVHHVAGTGEQGYSGDGGPARRATLGGPKGLAYSHGRLFVADTENHVIRRIDLKSGIITTVLGTGQRGDGPETDPVRCKLSRPHGLFAAGNRIYGGDSEAHRIRVLK